MKFLLDFFPIILFFIVYKNYGLNSAIIAMVFATILQIIYSRITTKKFEKMQVITLALLVLFGGLTIYINNPAFIMWKVSVLYVVFAFIILFSIFFGKKTLLERMLGKELTLPNYIWRRLSYAWGIGFIAIAIINGYFVKIASSTRELFFNNSNIDKTIQLTQIKCDEVTIIELCEQAQLAEESWVNFKLFGTLGITLLFIVITVIFISKYIKNEKNSSI